MKKVVLAVILILICAVLWFFVEPRLITVHRYKIQNSELKNIRIVFAADFHVYKNGHKRLEKTVKKALELGIKNFSTTLTVSPHKVSREIFKEADSLVHYGVNFVREDFKKQDGFLKTMQLAKENDFYRQTYCGCSFSIR